MFSTIQMTGPLRKVLAAGGFGGATCFDGVEIYDPALGTWSPAGNMVRPHGRHGAILLANGTEMAMGGEEKDHPAFISGVAELYDLVAGTWAVTGKMATARISFAAAPLPNGRVLVAGGIGEDIFTGTTGSAMSIARAESYNYCSLLPPAVLVWMR